MAIPFIDLKSQYNEHKTALDAAIQRVLDHGQYIMGPEIDQLESDLAQFVGVKHVLACSSGTDALVLPLMTQKLSAQDAVFTSPFTFFASAESISLAGGTPVFVDIDPITYNIDPVKLKAKINQVIDEGKLKPRGIIPVDLGAERPDLRRCLGELEDAGRHQNDRVAADRGVLSDAEQRPHQRTAARGHIIGSGESDRFTA